MDRALAFGILRIIAIVFMFLAALALLHGILGIIAIYASLSDIPGRNLGADHMKSAGVLALFSWSLSFAASLAFYKKCEFLAGFVARSAMEDDSDGPPAVSA